MFRFSSVTTKDAGMYSLAIKQYFSLTYTFTVQWDTLRILNRVQQSSTNIWTALHYGEPSLLDYIEIM